MTKFAIVFAGQGSQSLGMMAGLVDHPVVARTFEEASDCLSVDFGRMISHGPVEELNSTVNTQPLMLIAGVATYRAWQAAGGPTPNVFAGHSLGEYTALVTAGALQFVDALPLVRFRAQSMQDAVPEGEGGIAAILGMELADLRHVCVEAADGQVLEPANLNSPGQIVIAGDRAAVERAMTLAKARGARRAVMLPMSVPSHCALMHPAAERLASRLVDVPISANHVPVVQNADVMTYATADAIKAALVRQLTQPVRWIETVEKLVADGAAHVVECVPGKILTGLNKRINSQLHCLAVTDSASLAAAIAAVQA